MGSRYTGKTFIVEILAILLGLAFLVPFYYVISNSLKPFAEILSNTSALPKVLEFQNYVSAFEKLNYLKVFSNSLIVTIASNVVLVIFCSMAAYMLVQNKKEDQQCNFHDLCCGDDYSLSIHYDSTHQNSRYIWTIKQRLGPCHHVLRLWLRDDNILISRFYQRNSCRT